MPFNPQQQAIIDHFEGPCLVTAVPGSGKTTTITERTKKLLSRGIPPEQILAITFTNKAAKEMRERIGKAVGAEAKKITISTFHSLCAKMLREYPSQVGLKRSFSIYDDAEQESLLKTVMHRVEGDAFFPSEMYIKKIKWYLEYQRNSYANPTEAVAKYDLTRGQVKVIAAYYDELKNSNAIDFTGLLTETNRLMEENPSIKDTFQKRWRYISVDEVQDTNIAQYRFIKNLAAAYKNIVVVGDLDQSIYKFRSASPENVILFEEEFDAIVFKLEKNYRSTPDILGPSQKLIEHNTLRKATTLATDNCSNGDTPQVHYKGTEEGMVCDIAEKVKERIRLGTPANQIAILYRTNFASRSVEMALRAQRIKYKVIGGMSFWDRREVKYAMSALKFLANPQDQTSFRKAVEVCCRGVGDKGVSKIIDQADTEKSTVMAVARTFVAKGEALGKNIAQFITIVDSAMTPDHKLLNLMRQTSFIHKISTDSTSDDDRIANVTELADDLRRYLLKGGTLAGYLQQVSLASAADDSSAAGEVSLMTMHACKGLEFDAVFISHANEGYIPHKNVLNIPDFAEKAAQIEEERRLMYVAMTRAKKFLRIYAFKKKVDQDMLPSRFIQEAGLEIPGLKKFPEPIE